MNDDRSRRALMDFLDYLADKGLMAKNTVIARKAATNKVLSILSDDEATDVIAINLRDVMMRFQNLEGKKYTPGSLKTYHSRVRAALDDFESYLSNPLGFRPNIKSRVSTGKLAASEAPDKASFTGTASDPQPSQPVSALPASSSIMQIQIRPDLIIHIQGLPLDLTQTEAKKLSNVILAMAVLED